MVEVMDSFITAGAAAWNPSTRESKLLVCLPEHLINEVMTNALLKSEDVRRLGEAVRPAPVCRLCSLVCHWRRQGGR